MDTCKPILEINPLTGAMMMLVAISLAHDSCIEMAERISTCQLVGCSPSAFLVASFLPIFQMPASSILMGCSLINHPAIGVPPLVETPNVLCVLWSLRSIWLAAEPWNCPWQQPR